MKHLKTSAALVLIFCLSLIIPVSGQEQDMAAQQKAWNDYMTPGWAHQMMAEHSGEWVTVTKFWMDPSAPPQTMEGTAKSEMILGGRYLKSTHSGMMMGMPFEGLSLEGYDNAKEEFTSIWIDNMGTGTSISTGLYDKEKKILTYNGNVFDPMQGKDVAIREVISLIDKDSYKIEMYNEMNGQEIKSMEIMFTRKK